MSTTSSAEALNVPRPPLASGPNKLKRPVPAPAGLRPKKNDNQFPILNLIDVPKRILIPPKAQGVSSVRSFRETPLSDVKLMDVINNKHLSPLSLKDFEGHLVFREYSAENLYALLWLIEYTKEWEEWQKDPSAVKVAPTHIESTDPNATRTASHLPEHLSSSLRRGLEIFFAPNGPLELNLSANTRQKTLVAAGNSGDPADFAEARDVIEHSLNRSLAVHCRDSIANAGPRRLVFCFCLGLSIFLLGLIPPFVGIFGHHARAWRAIGLPFIMFGAAVMSMALQRICGVIWLLGEDRQLLPWELCSPTVTSGSIVSLNCPSTPRSIASWDDESVYAADDKGDSFRSANSSDPYPWDKMDEVELPAAANADHTVVNFSTPATPASSRPPSYTSKNPPRDVVPISSPVWAPVTPVFSKDVARAQWNIAVTSLGVGTFVMVAVGAVLMAVPNQ